MAAKRSLYPCYNFYSLYLFNGRVPSPFTPYSLFLTSTVRFSSKSKTKKEKTTEKRKSRTKTPHRNYLSSSSLPANDRPPPSKYSFYGQEPSTKSHNNDRESDIFLGKKDTREGRYYVYQTTNGSLKDRYRFPSVTTVLDHTKPRSSVFSLRNWRLSMIEEHGVEGFKKWKRNVIKVGQNFHSYLETKLKEKTKPVITSGSLPPSLSPTPPSPSPSRSPTHSPTSSPSHSPSPSPSSPSPSPSQLYPYNNYYSSHRTDLLCSLESCYSSLSPSLSPSHFPPSFDTKQLDNYRYMESIKDVLKDISVVMVTEGVVMHRELGYCGTVDCVAKYRDSICLIDWKTSFKPKPTIETLYDYPLQTAAYAGAINSNNEQYPFKVDTILIVVAYSTGFPAHTHLLTPTQCLHYWDKWLERLDQYQIQFAHDLSTVLV